MSTNIVIAALNGTLGGGNSGVNLAAYVPQTGDLNAVFTKISGINVIGRTDNAGFYPSATGIGLYRVNTTMGSGIIDATLQVAPLSNTDAVGLNFTDGTNTVLALLSNNGSFNIQAMLNGTVILPTVNVTTTLGTGYILEVEFNPGAGTFAVYFTAAINYSYASRTLVTGAGSLSYGAFNPTTAYPGIYANAFNTHDMTIGFAIGTFKVINQVSIATAFTSSVDAAANRVSGTTVLTVTPNGTLPAAETVTIRDDLANVLGTLSFANGATAAQNLNIVWASGQAGARTITSTASPAFGTAPTATVTVYNLALSPASQSAMDGASVNLTATLTGGTNTLAATVSGGGTLSTAAPTSGTAFQYTTPSTGTGTATITVTGPGGTSQTATVTYSAGEAVASMTGLTTLNQGQSGTYLVSVINPIAGHAFTFNWTDNAVAIVTGLTNPIASSSQEIYVAGGPSAAGAHAIACQVQDITTPVSVGTTSLSVTIAVVAISITSTAICNVGGTVSIAAAVVTGSTNTAVTYSGSAAAYYAGGVFTAPGGATLGQTFTLTATSTADNTKTALSTITITSTQLCLSTIQPGAGFSPLTACTLAVYHFPAGVKTLVTTSGLTVVEGTPGYGYAVFSAPGNLIAPYAIWSQSGTAIQDDPNVVPLLAGVQVGGLASGVTLGTGPTAATIAAAVMSDVTDVIGVDILAIKAKTDALSATPAADSTANLLANVRWQRQEAIIVGAYTKNGNVFTFTKQDGTLLLVTLDNSAAPTVRTPGS